MVELEELVVVSEREELSEGVEGEAVDGDQVAEAGSVETVELGEVGKSKVVEAEVVGAENIETASELETSGELVETTEGETALLLSNLLDGGGSSEGGKGADEDAGELHFDRERVGCFGLKVIKQMSTARDVQTKVEKREKE